MANSTSFSCFQVSTGALELSLQLKKTISHPELIKQGEERVFWIVHELNSAIPDPWCSSTCNPMGLPIPHHKPFFTIPLLASSCALLSGQAMYPGHSVEYTMEP